MVRIQSALLNASPRSWYQKQEYKFKVLCWNACGMEEGAIEDMIFLVSRSFEWDAVLLQEGPYSNHDLYTLAPGGHALLVGACSGIAAWPF